MWTPDHHVYMVCLLHFRLPLNQCVSFPDKTKEPTLPAPKPIQAGLHPSISSSHHPVPTLISAHGMYLGPGGTGPGALTPAMILQRNNEEERWLARQRKLRQEKEDRQYQVSEFRQQVLEQHLDIGRPGDVPELRNEGQRYLGSHFRDRKNLTLVYMLFCLKNCTLLQKELRLWCHLYANELMTWHLRINI